jgi:hypothetical protein
MLTAVQFYNQALLQTDKINNESTERLLPAKFVTAQLP